MERGRELTKSLRDSAVIFHVHLIACQVLFVCHYVVDDKQVSFFSAYPSLNW